jgi:PAS domain S-box-containing protein/diguanylate cyclase (GGDEF)-like protein
MTPNSALHALVSTLLQNDAADPAHEAFRQVLDAAPALIVLYDAGGRLLFANRRFAEYVGRSQDELAGSSVEDILPPQMAQDSRAKAVRALAGEVVHSEGWMPLGGGKGHYVHRVHAPLRHPDGTVSGYAVFIQDLTEQRNAQDDLFRLAYYDPMLGLANRLLLLKHAGDTMAVGEAFVLIIVDIDRFADIGTSLGQAFANELLLDLAQRLARDAGPFDLLARVSDHAFAMVLAGDIGPVAVEERVATVASIIGSARSSSGAAVFLTASIGVAVWTPAHQRPDDVLRDAEIATARAREEGGARHAWFNPGMYARVVEQVRLEHDLRRALESGDELWVAYQPIIEMVTGELAGFEALVRWNHPERGNIPPGVFIPIAESTGLVVALGAWVLRQACRQVADWQGKRPPGYGPLFMSVNLSTHQLSDPGFVSVVRSILRETRVEPAWIKLELTESAVMEKAEQSIKLLRAVRALGIKLSIDDFGTGYSSLSYLHKLPIDSLKVDRSFVSAMHQSEENRAIVRIIIDLARLLGFDVIAEGIETDADANLLRALACDYGQGYHFARPLPPGEAEALVGGNLPWRRDP